MRSLIRFGLGLVAPLALTSIGEPQLAKAQDAAVQATADDPWTSEELENLLAPVALYPDPILAQVLVAATYPDQIRAAAAYVERYGTAGLDEQPWEISVKAVAHYKPVLNLMAEGEDWTIALGQAYATQPQDVMDAVQGLRRMANAQGNLVTDERQRVVVEREVIRIEPAQPRVIYVPTYDPAVVYFRPIYVAQAHPSYWSWGVSWPVGVWLTYDFDWYSHRVYHHGWHVHGPHWVVVARPWVVISPWYVAPRHTTIIVNRGIVNRRFNPYPLRRYTVVHKNTNFDRRGNWDRRVGKNDGRPDRVNRATTGDRRAAPVPTGSRVADRRQVLPERAPTSARRVTPISGGPSDDRRTDAARSERRTPTPVGGTRAASERTSNGTWNPRADRGDRGAQPSTNRSSMPDRSRSEATPRPSTVRDAVSATRQRAPSAQPSAPSRSSTAAPRSSAPKPSGSARGSSSSRPPSAARGSSGTRSSGSARPSSSGSRSSGSARSSSGSGSRSSSGRGSSSRRPE
ncbi:MAG: DUF3300 domain-containing protein [Gemmatimonadaceae bacterium]|nr:DUF3300 domain-containing protein [Gemmatimonadaceae bacterium]